MSAINVIFIKSSNGYFQQKILLHKKLLELTTTFAWESCTFLPYWSKPLLGAAPSQSVKTLNDYTVWGRWVFL